MLVHRLFFRHLHRPGIKTGIVGRKTLSISITSLTSTPSHLQQLWLRLQTPLQLLLGTAKVEKYLRCDFVVAI